VAGRTLLGCAGQVKLAALDASLALANFGKGFAVNA